MEQSCLSGPGQTQSASCNVQGSFSQVPEVCIAEPPLEESGLDRAARDRLAAIGQSVTCFTHQALNVLQCSQACLQLLRLEIGERAQAADYLNRLQKAQESLQRLCDNVREFAAPLQLQPRRCDARDIWLAAWDGLRWRRADRPVLFQEHIATCDRMVHVDPLYLEQVFANLFDNALAACSDPAEITVRCMAAEIDGTSALAIAVGDNGPGFSAEQLRRPFAPFFTTKRAGTGLGLLIARKVVQAHGGRLALGVSPAHGAEIHLALPGGQG
jgi:signal transduction histidine kinase